MFHNLKSRCGWVADIVGMSHKAERGVVSPHPPSTPSIGDQCGYAATPELHVHSLKNSGVRTGGVDELW